MSSEGCFNRRRSGTTLALLLLASLVGSGATALFAQDTPTPGSSAKPGPTPKPQAYVRFWNMLIGPNSPDLQLMLAEEKLLTVGSSANASAGYLSVDPGTYNLTVRRSTESNAVIKRIPIVLRGDVYVTLLADLGKDGKPDVEVLDDTVNPKTDDNLGKLVVRQFFPGANVAISINAQPPGAPLTFGETTTLEHLPLHGTIVNMRATGMGPTAKTWNVEADFATGGHHATMLVLPDPYGRFRPRLVFDGSARKPEPAPTPPSAGPGAPAARPPSS